MTNETQKTVAEWSLKTHTGISLNQIIKDLAEELAEMSVATGVISADEICNEITRVYRELKTKPQTRADLESGIADVQIILYALAEHQGLSVQECLDTKMKKNRERTAK